VRNDGDVKTLDELKGKKVGVSTVGSVTGWLVGETARRQGWGNESMTLTPIGDDASRVAAVEIGPIGAKRCHLVIAALFDHQNDAKLGAYSNCSRKERLHLLRPGRGSNVEVVRRFAH